MAEHAEQRIFDILLQGDEVTWQSLLQDLVRVENMDPWDIDISKLSHRYIEMLKKMQEMNLRMSGKVVLAAAIMLKMKSNYLMDRDLLNFDKLMHPEEYTEDALYEDEQKPRLTAPDGLRLLPKTPQPRKRKVSIYELVDALRQALEVKNRRRQILAAVNIPVPEKKVDISKIIEQLYSRIEEFLSDKESITFSELVPSDKREDKIVAFLPMLHLSNQRKIDLEQQTHFGEIEIMKPNPGREKTASAQHEEIDFDDKHDFVEDALEESEKLQKKKSKKR
jgi:segregation and condensation protein A